MAYRLLAALVVALAEFLVKRIERGSVAVDADRDLDRLRRAGGRLREWMREDGSGERRKPDADRTRDGG
jgi:hypothetical protein